MYKLLIIMKESFKNAPLWLRIYSIFGVLVCILHLYFSYFGDNNKNKTDDYIQRAATSRVIIIK